MVEITPTQTQRNAVERIVSVLCDDIVSTRDDWTGNQNDASGNTQDSGKEPEVIEALLIGPAGSGKTYTCSLIIQELLRRGEVLYYMAPTWKAARRLESQVRRVDRYGIATSIHRRIYGPPVRRQVESGAELAKDKLRFTLRANYDDIEEGSIWLVDEVSMLGWGVGRDIRKVAKMRRCRILWVGDAAQLPPVNEGAAVNFRFPTAELTEVHRQEGGSPILELATFVRGGGPIERFRFDKEKKDILWYQETALRGVAAGFVKRMDQDWNPEAESGDVIIVTYRNEDRRAINAAVQVALGRGEAEVSTGPMQRIWVGDRIIGAGSGSINNGDHCKVLAVRPASKASVVYGEDELGVEELWEEHLSSPTPYARVKVHGPTGVAVLTVAGKVVRGTDPKSYLGVRLHGRQVKAEEKRELANAVQGTGLLRTKGVHLDAYPDLGYAATVHKCVAPNTLVETPDGLMFISEIGAEGVIGTPGGLSAYCEKVVNQESVRLRIETADGYWLDVTPDHAVDVWSESVSDYVRVEAKDLRVRDFVRLKLSPSYDVQTPVRLPVLPQDLDVRSIRHVAPTHCTIEMAEFLGLMVGDGTVYSRGFRLAKRHIEVSDRFAYLCEALFRVSPKRQSKANAHFVEINSVQLAQWLISIGGMSPNNKMAPAVVLRSSIECQRAFLRGLFEDGSVHLQKGQEILDHIEWMTVYPDLENCVRVMLLRMGIICGLAVDANGYRRLMIYGANAQKFGNEIGFLTPEKQRRTQLPMGEERKYIVPLSKPEAQDLYKRKVIRNGQYCNILRSGGASRHVAKSIQSESVLIAERLQWHHSRVKSVKEIASGVTMCVEVPDGHRFLQNGISGWNCQGSSYKAVFFAVNPNSLPDDTEAVKLNYTAITRAERVLRVIRVPDLPAKPRE